jgi:hypothetical protein
MLCRELIAVCSEIHTKHINTLCGQNVEFVNVKPGGTYSNHWALEASLFASDLVGNKFGFLPSRVTGNSSFVSCRRSLFRADSD